MSGDYTMNTHGAHHCCAATKITETQLLRYTFIICVQYLEILFCCSCNLHWSYNNNIGIFINFYVYEYIHT